jgi:predicted NACHT family NTPase
MKTMVFELAGLIDGIVGLARGQVLERAQRSEAVIKLLQQAGLDPEHPPADFTGVYQYTLVAYGVGKRREVLEVFRQSEIQEIFRRSFEANQIQILFSEGDRFLEGRDLGDALRDLHIDMKREFYEFISHFMRVLQRSRTPAQVAEYNAIQGMRRDLERLQDHLQRLPTVEALRTELARIGEPEVAQDPLKHLPRVEAVHIELDKIVYGDHSVSQRLKFRHIEQQIQNCIDEYEAISQALSTEINPSHRLRLERQLGQKETELIQLEKELAQLEQYHSTALSWSQTSRAFALSQQIRGWFEVLDYEFEDYEHWDQDSFEWILKIRERRQYYRIVIKGVDGVINLADVNRVRKVVAEQQADEGWVVTARRISPAAAQAVQNEKSLSCLTFDELLDQDADFSDYLDQLAARIQMQGIDQKYVPLACRKDEIDEHTQQKIGVSEYNADRGWIEGCLDEWLEDPSKEHILVLGEFGTGKTWFSLHYAWLAMEKYKQAKQRKQKRPRLPLVIPLRDYAKAVSVESLFSEFFFRQYQMRGLNYQAFEQLNRMGKLLLIFDGFDEMAARVDRQEMINNFWELAKVVVPGAKVILTCRTEHFPEAQEGRKLLNAELQASTRPLTGETPP